jgi:uncharacterized protein YecE (DUF72 family)
MAWPLLKVGCCGFRLTRAEYARQFRVVEVQQTFYQPPQLPTLRRWRAEVPPDFEFTLKAWQLITHPSASPTYKRLTTKLSEKEREESGSFQATNIVEQAWQTTRACAEALGARYVSFQCPASFTPTPPHVANLRQFVARLERRGLRLLWEPRGNWPDALIGRLCQELDLVHVVDPFHRQTVTHELFYWRLHGGKDFRHDYTAAELRQLLNLLPPDKPAYVLFNNLNMVDDARRFQELARSEEGPTVGQRSGD